MSWPTVAVHEVAKINPKLEVKCKPSSESIVSFVPMASVSDETQTIETSADRPYAEVAKGYTSFFRNDIIVAKITPCFENGKMAHATNLKHELGFGSTEFHVIRPNQEVHGSYLFNLLKNSYVRQAGQMKMKGAAGQRRVPAEFFANLQIPLPPLPEQKRIAAILDAADALRAKRRESIEQLDTLLQSTFLEMFGDPVTNPKGWGTIGYGECIKSGPKNGLHKTKEFIGRGYPLLDNKGLYRSMWADFSNLRLIEVSKEELEKYRVRNGDVIVNRVSVKPEGVGLPVLVNMAPTDCVFESNMMRITPDTSIIEPIYFVFCLRTNGMRKRTINAANLANQASINQTGLRSIKLIHPPLDLQQRFATIVESIESQKTRYRAHLAELDTLFASLQSRAFNGEL
jgi:type I restriction enzyme S subunit